MRDVIARIKKNATCHARESLHLEAVRSDDSGDSGGTGGAGGGASLTVEFHSENRNEEIDRTKRTNKKKIKKK